MFQIKSMVESDKITLFSIAIRELKVFVAKGNFEASRRA